MPALSRQPSVCFTLRKLGHYYVRMLPQIRRCIHRWEQRARAIPSPELRRDAVQTINEKTTYVEAAAAFATLAAPASRSAAIEFIVAWQIICDYMDALGEQPSAEPFANNMQLHRAIVAAVDPTEPLVDYYAHHVHGGDGGYADALITTCREHMRMLPLSTALQPLATAAAKRCREAQSHVHAIGRTGATDALRRWTQLQTRTGGYAWWEIAAAGISGIAIPPLIAAAANPATMHAALTRIHDAYWPHICALSVMLDSVADQHSEADGFSFLSHYPSSAALAAGLAVIATNASRVAGTLPDPGIHHMIVASTIAYYITDGAAAPEVTATLGPLYSELRPTTTLIALALRTRQRLHHSQERASPAAPTP